MWFSVPVDTDVSTWKFQKSLNGWSMTSGASGREPVMNVTTAGEGGVIGANGTATLISLS